MSNTKRVHVLVHGRVQGVGFRYFAQRVAMNLGVAGQVRNMGDGRVEIIAEAGEETLQLFLKRIEDGPSFGHVSSVDVEWSDAVNQFSGFKIAY